jgi:putative PIG3 family NAD(P)H quinone oxidoreductase
MRAVLPSGKDGSGVPRLGEVPDPVPAAGEVLVQNAATGLNRADILQLRGQYPPPPGESAVPGMECAGTVIALGTGVAGWSVGDRVMALIGGGGQGEKVAIPAGQLMPLPDSLEWAAGGAIPEAGLTAWSNLVTEGGLEDGETVLVTGASGGVGSFAAQLARELGAKVITAARDRERLERLKDYGIDTFVTDDEGLVQEVKDATGGKGVDFVLDLVGGRVLGRHLDCLRPGGRLVLVGALGGAQAEIDAGGFLRRRLRMIGSTLRGRSRAEKAELVRAFTEFAGPRLAAGTLRPIIDRVVPFERIADAYQALSDGEPFGKIVVSFP